MNEQAAPGWPNLAKAAELVGVHQATLQRSGLNLPILPAGRKEKLVAPIGVLAAALHFRRRPLREVATDVIAVAQEKCPEFVDVISSEVDAFLDAQAQSPQEDAEDLLSELKETLPTGIYRRIDATYRRGSRQVTPTGRTPRTAAADRSRRAAKVPV